MYKGYTQRGPRKGGYCVSNGCITKLATRRAARRGGVKRIGGVFYEESCHVWAAVCAQYKYTVVKRRIMNTVGIKHIQCVSKYAIRHLARRGNVKRFSGLIYEEARSPMKAFITRIIYDIITFVVPYRLGMVTTEDVVFALNRMGSTNVGFGIQSPDPYRMVYTFCKDFNL